MEHCLNIAEKTMHKQEKIHPDLIVICQEKPPSKRWFQRNSKFFQIFISWRNWNELIFSISDFDEILNAIAERSEDTKWQ